VNELGQKTLTEIRIDQLHMNSASGESQNADEVDRDRDQKFEKILNRGTSNGDVCLNTGVKYNNDS